MGWRTRPELTSTSHVLLQATPFCNIDCSYCYLPNRSDKRALPLDLLAKLCSELVENGALGPELRVSWHVGEPLAVRPAQMEAYCELIRRMLTPHTKLTLSMQTNAMLVNDEWIDLIRRYDIRIGVSLDGPKQFHDTHRLTRKGEGTFDAVMRGVERLQRAGISFGVICVLTPASLREPDLMFDFFAGNGIEAVCFNVEEAIGVNRVDLTEQRDLAYAFFGRYFERVSKHGCSIDQ